MQSKTRTEQIPSEEVHSAIYRAIPNAYSFTIVPGSYCTIVQPSTVAILSVTQPCTSQSADTVPVSLPPATQ